MRRAVRRSEAIGNKFCALLETGVEKTKGKEKSPKEVVQCPSQATVEKKERKFLRLAKINSANM